MKKQLLLALLAASLPTITFAQSTTLQQIRSIFQANCTTGCHSGANPSASLDLSGNASDLMDALVGVTPVNPAAAAKGRKLVDPGYPHNSFLLYKCAYTAWDDQFERELAEGTAMPQNQAPLEKEQVELIRQWILYGAPETGAVVSQATLFNYYHNNGMARIEKPEAPAPGEGFQMHMGPFFLEPGDEVEFYKKENLEDHSEHDVVKFEAFFNDDSHHFLLFELDEATAASEEGGLRPVGVENAFQNPYMIGWVDPDVTELPYGTAYKINENASIDLNYHIINYASNGDSIQAAEAYVNFYLDNEATDLIEMESDLLINLNIFIPNTGNEVSFTDVATFGPSSNDSIYIWFLSSHTHKYGTDYDIYKRNPDGSRGDQLYEGFYNTTYDFNAGYYDWEHPANLYLDEVYGEMIPISEKDGLVQEAKYRIPGSANEPSPFVTFGLTTNDEMMLSFIQYTRERVTAVDPNGIGDVVKNEPSFISVYPNPTNGTSNIRFSLDESADVQLSVFNSLGQEVKQLYAGSMTAGQANFTFDAATGSDPNGLYLIQLIVNDRVYSERLLHLNR